MKNRDRTSIGHNEYLKNRGKRQFITDDIDSLHHSPKGNVKTSSTKDILGADINTHKNLVEYQMTPEMSWSNKKIDCVEPICFFMYPMRTNTEKLLIAKPLTLF